MPQKLLIVVPPILIAAIPVGATTAMFFRFLCNSYLILRNNKDFPVPATPVIKTLFPLSTISNPRFWVSSNGGSLFICAFSIPIAISFNVVFPDFLFFFLMFVLSFFLMVSWDRSLSCTLVELSSVGAATSFTKFLSFFLILLVT